MTRLIIKLDDTVTYIPQANILMVTTDGIETKVYFPKDSPLLYVLPTIHAKFIFNTGYISLPYEAVKWYYNGYEYPI